MKITVLERAMIVLVLLALAFFGGFYYRGTVTADTILVETEHSAPTSASQAPVTPEVETAEMVPEHAVFALDPAADTNTDDLQERSIPQNTDDRIDLNTETQEELESLPGIGSVLAARIIEYRETYGGFYSIEEIVYVSGIGEKTFENIADLIKVEGEK